MINFANVKFTPIMHMLKGDFPKLPTSLSMNQNYVKHKCQWKVPCLAKLRFGLIKLSYRCEILCSLKVKHVNYR